MGDEHQAPEQSLFWTARLDDRTRKHVEYAQHYAHWFAHGAPGHLDLMTIAKLAGIIDALAAQGVSIDVNPTG